MHKLIRYGFVAIFLLGATLAVRHYFLYYRHNAAFNKIMALSTIDGKEYVEAYEICTHLEAILAYDKALMIAEKLHSAKPKDYIWLFKITRINAILYYIYNSPDNYSNAKEYMAKITSISNMQPGYLADMVEIMALLRTDEDQIRSYIANSKEVNYDEYRRLAISLSEFEMISSAKECAGIAYNILTSKGTLTEKEAKYLSDLMILKHTLDSGIRIHNPSYDKIFEEAMARKRASKSELDPTKGVDD